MGDISGNNSLKCIIVTRWVDEFNMDIFSTRDNTRLKYLNEPLLYNRLMLNMKL